MAKSTSKKAAKKAPAKKAAKKEVVVYTADQVELTAAQSKTLEMIQRNQIKIEDKAMDMLKIANDSGERLMKLKDEVTKKFGRVWKAWAQTEGNLPIGYEQATRYMKLAGASDTEFDAITSTSIEGAVKQIEHMRKPEKAVAAAEAKAQKQKQKIATAGIISNATIEEVEACTDVQELRNLIKIIHARIDELQDGGEVEEDIEDADFTEVAEDEQEAIADVLS